MVKTCETEARRKTRSRGEVSQLVRCRGPGQRQLAVGQHTDYWCISTDVNSQGTTSGPVPPTLFAPL